jgi:hypothetical protein
MNVWVQPSLFPEFPTNFYAYQMDGGHGIYWEVYDDGPTVIGVYEEEEFNDFLDFARSINYDVLINTYESWEAME